jgi:hypothetical protein
MTDEKTIRQCSCHCVGVRWTIAAPEELRGARCNCTICAMKGVVMVGVRLADLNILQGADLLTAYTFNTHAAKHFFCSVCGIHCFHQRRFDPGEYAVNAACIEGVSPYDFSPVVVMNGQHHPLDRKEEDRGKPFGSAGTMFFEPAPD